MYKILVVDDEARIRSIIKKYAEFEGHTVTEAGDGMEAVRLCRKESYDIIIMDINDLEMFLWSINFQTEFKPLSPARLGRFLNMPPTRR